MGQGDGEGADTSAAASLFDAETTVELAQLIDAARTGPLTSLTGVSAQGHWRTSELARHTPALLLFDTHASAHQ